MKLNDWTGISNTCVSVAVGTPEYGDRQCMADARTRSGQQVRGAGRLAESPRADDACQGRNPNDGTIGTRGEAPTSVLDPAVDLAELHQRAADGEDLFRLLGNEQVVDVQEDVLAAVVRAMNP
ncbi:hypothetical protein HFP71_00800 [Streptomyces sp. ARC32]